MTVEEPRRRRSTEEVGSLIVDAARSLFRSHGFDATSTKAIAERAGVAESMIFRRYESKGALYDDAVIGPFVDYVDAFTDRWRRAPSSALVPEHLARDYVVGLYRLCREHRDLLALLVAAQSPDDDQGARLVGAVEHHVAELAATVEDYTRRLGIPLAVSPESAVRLAVSATLGAASMGIDEEDLDDLIGFVMRGVGFTPRPPTGPGTPRTAPGSAAGRSAPPPP